MCEPESVIPLMQTLETAEAAGFLEEQEVLPLNRSSLPAGGAVIFHRQRLRHSGVSERSPVPSD